MPSTNLGKSSKCSGNMGMCQYAPDLAVDPSHTNHFSVLLRNLSKRVAQGPGLRQNKILGACKISFLCSSYAPDRTGSRVAQTAMLQSPDVMLMDYRVLEREYLLAISRAITAELDLADVLRIVAGAAVDLVSGKAGIIALADPRDGRFRIAAVYGIQQQHVQHFAPLLVGLPYQEGAEHEIIPELTERMKQIALCGRFRSHASVAATHDQRRDGCGHDLRVSKR